MTNRLSKLSEKDALIKRELYRKVTADYFSEIRARKGVIQLDLQTKTAIQQSSISKIEHGYSLIDIDVFTRLCKGLDIDPYQTLREINSKVERSFKSEKRKAKRTI